MQPTVPYNSVPKLLLVINSVVAVVYFGWWLIPSHMGNPWLYGFLVFGEIYHIIMALLFWFTVWPSSKKPIPPPLQTLPSVDVFIPVAGEPDDIIKVTALAAKFIDYPNHTVYILNDGKVASKENWRQVISLAKEIGVKCITRTNPGGAKAGNINHALQSTKGEYIAIFDADMVPHYDFLQKMMPYFHDSKVGFVQSPQFYKNHSENEVTSSAWDQQKLFFGPILTGKDKSNAVFICGTNVVIRRKALESVGGMVEDNIAEDFLTSLLIHKKGWKSQYVSEVLAEGLAPQDLQAYYKQQFRWTRGSLEVLFAHNPIFSRKINFGQKIQYLSSALYYINGLIVFIDMIMPLIYLFAGIQPVNASTTSFAIFFLPFMFLNLYTLYISSGTEVSFNTFSFSYSLWFLQLQSLFSLILNKSVSFVVTPKNSSQGRYPLIALPHMLYITVSIIGAVVAINRESITPSVVTNIAWVMFSAALFLPFISIALGLSRSNSLSASPLVDRAV